MCRRHLSIFPEDADDDDDGDDEDGADDGDHADQDEVVDQSAASVAAAPDNSRVGDVGYAALGLGNNL